MTDCTEIHVGDINVRLLITIKDDGSVVDIGDATLLEIFLRKPVSDGLLTKSATLYTDGSDGIMYYDSVSGDFDEVGMWKIQGAVTMNSGYYQSPIMKFKVLGNI